MTDEKPTTEKLANEAFIRKLAVKYVKYKDMDWAATELGVEGDDIEEVFLERPDLEEKFDDMVYRQSTKLGYRKIRAGLDEAIGKLNELVSDGEGDENTAYKAASKLLDVWSRLDAVRKEKEEDDDLDTILKEVSQENGSGSEESS